MQIFAWNLYFPLHPIRSNSEIELLECLFFLCLLEVIYWLILSVEREREGSPVNTNSSFNTQVFLYLESLFGRCMDAAHEPTRDVGSHR